jgi:hypothetical protein
MFSVGCSMFQVFISLKDVKDIDYFVLITPTLNLSLQVLEKYVIHSIFQLIPWCFQGFLDFIEEYKENVWIARYSDMNLMC